MARLLPVTDEAAALRVAIDLMAWPCFALGKRPRHVPIVHEYRGDFLRVMPVSDGPGLATIWDADLLIWAVSQLVEAHGRRLSVSPVLMVSGFQVLRFLGRGTGQTQYHQLAAALDRLAGSVVETSVGASLAVPARFRWIEGWARTDGGLTIVVAEWLLAVVIERRRVLRIDPAYLRLSSGIARWLWRLLRRHAHEKSTGWEITLLALYARSGSLARPTDFVADLRRIARANALPGYRLSLVWRGGEERLRAARSRPVDRRAACRGCATNRWARAAARCLERLSPASGRRAFRAHGHCAGVARRAVFRADGDRLDDWSRDTTPYPGRAPMMPPRRTMPSILLFGPGTAILPSRPSSAWSSRTAAVKAGHRPPRGKRGLALKGASTAAADRLRSGDLFRAGERIASWIS